MKYTKNNKFFDNTLDNKQLYYNLIYNLKLLKLGTINNFIDINLINNFIKFLKDLIF